MHTHDADVARHPQHPRLPRHARRSLAARILLGSLFTVCLSGAVFGLFELSIWHMAVDSYTFTARGGNGQVIAHVVSHDPRVASALRQRINSALNDPSQDLFGPACNEPIYTGPYGSYVYDFRAGGRLIETVWATRTDCGDAWVTCGGITLMTGNGTTIMPITFHSHQQRE